MKVRFKPSGCLIAMLGSIVIWIIFWIIFNLLVSCTSSKPLMPTKKDYVLTPDGWVHKNLMTSQEKKANKEWIKSMKP